MKNIIYLLILTIVFTSQGTSQELSLSPKNNSANLALLKSEKSKMSWSMVKDSTEIKIGDIHSIVRKEKDSIIITTTVLMHRSNSKWIDSTIVGTKNLKPIYHSSYNQQRDMVLKFGKKITGYYLDKQANTKTKISEEVKEPFFDSNFYPQLLRLLPLNNGYSKTISIFDYNPKAKIGVLTASIKDTKESTLEHNGKLKQVWKIETTDEISNNTSTITYYIDMLTRKILKQELDLGSRKMIMRLVE
ncbi:hypothetical protein KXJ69_01625 [Aureisphaera sp. CAU 1614]|uniref:DUF3108 domain-containing protein n=1 Tax=Halomarinibacterium sedimenti TaxID=2857106 RepID=A0A9X1JUM5_9FLAO|nr:hypothetical protein [Halomarinibacterium sedimenti]MBW2936785.1 hypothetical protein [Halomarinibacterium sedimenti]